jgi:hypothetical protein
MQGILPQGSRKQNLQRFREFDLQGTVFAISGGGRDLGLTLAEELVEARGQGILLSLVTSTKRLILSFYSVLPRPIRSPRCRIPRSSKARISRVWWWTALSTA